MMFGYCNTIVGISKATVADAFWLYKIGRGNAP
jgi:hypothetical protein